FYSFCISQLTPPVRPYTASPDIYPLSLHDALPIYIQREHEVQRRVTFGPRMHGFRVDVEELNKRLEEGRERKEANLKRLNDEYGDRKSTRLNSSHVKISYAVFCLKKKTNTTQDRAQ